MKLAAFICCLLCASASAATLSWDANPEATVAGYRIYWGNESRFYLPYDSVLDVGNVTSNVLMQATGRVFYALTAYDNQLLESEYSDEVFYDWPTTNLPPSRPMNLRITGTNAVAQIRLQQSTGLAAWQDTGVAFVPVTNQALFFRAAAPASGSTVLPKAMTTLKTTAGSKSGKHPVR